MSPRAGRRAEADSATGGPAPAASPHRHPPARLAAPAAQHLLGLQSLAGNAAVASRLAPTTSVQRVVSSAELVALRYTGFFGNTGQEQYAAVVHEVAQYHDHVKSGTPTRGTLARIRDAVDAWRAATTGRTGDKHARRHALLTQLRVDADGELTAQDGEGERVRAECAEAVRQIDRESARPDSTREGLAGLKQRFRQREAEVARRIRHTDGDSVAPVDAELEAAHKRDRGQLADVLLARTRTTAVATMATLNTSDRFQYRHNMPPGQQVYRLPRATWTPASPLPGSPGASAQLSFSSTGRPSAAVRALFGSADTRRVVVECTAAISICYFRAILETVGDDRFDRLFAGGISITSHLSDELEPLLEHVAVTDGSEVRAGDWVYFLNHLSYAELHDRGAFSGENALALGHDRYEGFGVPRVSELEMLSTLATHMFGLSLQTGDNDLRTRENNVRRVEKRLELAPFDRVLPQDLLKLQNARSRRDYNRVVASYNGRLAACLAAFTDAGKLAYAFDLPGLGKRQASTGSNPTATAERTVGRLRFDPIATT